MLERTFLKTGKHPIKNLIKLKPGKNCLKDWGAMPEETNVENKIPNE
ncbi:MAG: hypothetical protein GTO16_01940 [Candidatus Aminicenantes bacterium]|nr:hypothetical protein [Candidatus Aminicenantes bacterium]